MPSPTRREFLTAVGVTLAGCATSQKPTSLAIGESVEVDGMTLAAENPRVRKQVVWQGQAHDRLRTHDGQYLLVDVRGWQRPGPPTETPPPPPPEPFEPLDVVLDGRPQQAERVWELAEVPPGQTPGESETYQRHPREGEYVPGVAVPIPVAEPASATVRWVGDDRTVDWQLRDDILETMAQVPQFKLRSLEGRAVDADTVEVRVRVANSGDRDGVWYVSHARGSANVFHSLLVPAGEVKAGTFRPEQLEPPTAVRVSSANTDRSIEIPDSSSGSRTVARGPD